MIEPPIFEGVGSREDNESVPLDIHLSGNFEKVLGGRTAVRPRPYKNHVVKTLEFWGVNFAQKCPKHPINRFLRMMAAPHWRRCHL
jgi:hypothetical protein